MKIYNYMEDSLNSLLGIINLQYILTCNIATYVIITTLPWDFKRTGKRIIATISAILIFGAMLLIQPEDKWESLFYGFFLQYLSWDYCFKYVINWVKEKFKVNPDSDLSVDEVDTTKVAPKKTRKKNENKKV